MLLRLPLLFLGDGFNQHRFGHQHWHLICDRSRVGNRQKNMAESAENSLSALQTDEVAMLGTHSLILVFASMLMISFLCWLSIDPLFTAMGAEPELLPLIHSYLDIYLPGSVLFTTTMICGSIMRANGSAAFSARS